MNPTSTTAAARTFQDLDPATGETIAEIDAATPTQIAEAVARARAAQASWADTPFDQRARLLLAGAESISARTDEFAEKITREMGKPLADAKKEVQNWSAGVALTLKEVGAAIEPEILREEKSETRVVRDPLGVVAAITPWNFPVGMPLELLTPALATGNTVVFKPSELVPLSGALLAECLNEHLPSDALTLIQGAGQVGAELVASDVDMIAFIGSRATGKRIMESASTGLKRLVLELGGKDPLVVFGDADLEAAADCAVLHSLRNTGQVCCSVERIFVDQSVAAEFEQLVLERARAWKHGNGFEEGVKMGPLVSAEQRRKVVEQVQGAVAGGARLVLGGEEPAGEGWFYPATILADVTEDLALSREETFGPVISLSRFDGDEDEAVRLANDTPYGLGANVFTADLEKGKRVARGIRSGQVGVNRYLAGSPSAPWVGARQSGFGYLGSVDGHRQFTVPKSISFPV